MAQKEVFSPLLDFVDVLVELYLGSFIRPFVAIHEKFYGAINQVLRQILDDHVIPVWCTANFITYARTILVVPTLLLLAWGHTLVPSLLVVLVDLGDFLDGVVARFWNDKAKEKESSSTDDKVEKRASSPTNSDKDSFEVVVTGSPHCLDSWVTIHRQRSYGGFVDAVCDKAFVIPCWILLLNTVPGSTYIKLLQYFTLFSLILAETASGCIRFRAYFTSGGLPAPKVEGFDFSSSAVTADHVGKAKQTFEMMGTALFIIPLTRYLGVLVLFLAVPLAYESVRRKVISRVVYVSGDVTSFDHKTIRLWIQAKAMGSKLYVGVPGESMTDKILNACSVSCVDQVIAEAPAKADLMFLEKYGIDFCVISPGQSKFVTDEVIHSNRCLQLGEDGIARPLNTKSQSKSD
ncbi:hypothetical protein FisN_11Lh100 [Fistulifera solaris]|uniref:Uncharacterized protein n=1 Tax=Fistulifera solaris TaxID=1519565 RepID=A0A1Z5J7D9_FISSO|nr:hypothetical protein FisN_11Lh100 [Fistulifera solaris]|eukprot:GAX09915.1 hypothetical protein FisN_11Lh100 [Fistulifera solaris]